MGAQGPSSDISFTVFKGNKSGEIAASTASVPSLTADQVLVSITVSGLCGTDLHYKKSGIALGHEGAGIVKATGPAVRNLKVGDHVGWGYQHDSCGQCDQCLRGFETFCPERHLYGSHEKHQGSIGTGAVWREAFLFRIPEGMSDEDAAPLMCGGATVFNALEMYQTDPTARVGIVGVGGLGHLAIQFASKMGCDTVVFSGTDSKKDEAMKLGANAFFAMKDVKPNKLDIGRKVDVLLVTTSAQPDWKVYLPLMAPNAKIFPLSVSEDDLNLPYMPLLLSGISIQGSLVAPRWVHKKMLEFAALHNIKPMNNTFEMNEDGVNKAFETLENGKMRYRGILVTPKESRL